MSTILCHPAYAQFGGGVFVCANCATEPTAVSIKIMHDLEYAKQILQYAIQVQQLADAIRNTTHGGPAAPRGPRTESLRSPRPGGSSQNKQAPIFASQSRANVTPEPKKSKVVTKIVTERI
jgi:hypothetical protein